MQAQLGRYIFFGNLGFDRNAPALQKYKVSSNSFQLKKSIQRSGATSAHGNDLLFCFTFNIDRFKSVQIGRVTRSTT